MVQATAASQERRKKIQASYLCLWGNNSLRNQILLLWSRFVSPTLLWNPHMLYLHFPNSPMFSSPPSVSIIIHEYIGHLGTGLPVSRLFLWLQKEDDATSVPIESTSILLTTLVLLRKRLLPREQWRLLIHFRIIIVKNKHIWRRDVTDLLVTLVVLLLLWSGFSIPVPCKFPKYLTCRRSDMLISNLL